MNPKPKRRSRLIWLGYISLAVAVLSDPSVMAVIPLEWLPKISAVTALLTIILRHRTNQPVGKP